MDIIHIHSDIKFVKPANLFFNYKEFNNKVILLGEKDTNNDELIYYIPTRKNLQKIIDLCKNVDLVILYNLDGAKSYIINRLSTTVKIIWRFFGMELYGKMPDYVFSDLTIKLIKDNEIKKNKDKSFWDKSIKPVLSKVKWRTDFKTEFEKAIERIDYFLGLSEVEYFFLKKKWPNLPSFMQIPFSFIKIKEVYNKQKKNKILIGNNRSAFNNHLDTLNLIRECKNKNNYSFNLMFNYANYTTYSNKVIIEAKKIDSIRIIENFMPFDEYQNFFISMDAFVLNGYRQMAMRAVFESLTSGVKVYLNNKNIMLQWLKKEGFIIFNMEDFSNDMANDNLSLSKENVKFNVMQFNKFKDKYNLEDFQTKILNLG